MTRCRRACVVSQLLSAPVTQPLKIRKVIHTGRVRAGSPGRLSKAGKSDLLEKENIYVRLNTCTLKWYDFVV
jgi:hypothetical protein